MLLAAFEGTFEEHKADIPKTYYHRKSLGDLSVEYIELDCTRFHSSFC